MRKSGLFAKENDEYYTAKYAEIIKLWDVEQLSAFRICERTGLPPSTIYAAVSRLRQRGLIGSHQLGRPRVKAIDISKTIWDAAHNPVFKRNHDFSSLEEAAKKRNITMPKLIRRIIFECMKDASLIDNILDDDINS